MTGALPLLPLYTSTAWCWQLTSIWGRSQEWLELCLYSPYTRPRSDVDHSLPSRTEIKNEWSYTSTPHIYFHGVDKDNFAYSLSLNFQCSIYYLTRPLKVIFLSIRFSIFTSNIRYDVFRLGKVNHSDRSSVWRFLDIFDLVEALTCDSDVNGYVWW